MNGKRITWIVVLLVLADQLLKIWIKTHLMLDEEIVVIPDWFRLHFVENNGFAFGMQIRTSGGFDWGKLLLGLFRIGMVGGIVWLLRNWLKSGKRVPAGVYVGMAMILAGALGNIIDSAFYGLLFGPSTPSTVAEWGGGYAGFMMGRVVDMFYFPLFQWTNIPNWLSFLVDSRGYFFGAIFNLADAYISVAVVYLLLFHYKFFNE